MEIRDNNYYLANMKYYTRINNYRIYQWYIQSWFVCYNLT